MTPVGVLVGDGVGGTGMSVGVTVGVSVGVTVGVTVGVSVGGNVGGNVGVTGSAGVELAEMVAVAVAVDRCGDPTREITGRNKAPAESLSAAPPSAMETATARANAKAIHHRGVIMYVPFPPRLARYSGIVGCVWERLSQNRRPARKDTAYAQCKQRCLGALGRPESDAKDRLQKPLARHIACSNNVAERQIGRRQLLVLRLRC